MKIGIYPGSFDPVTLGHQDIINRASQLVDTLVLGVLNNANKNPLFSVEERVSMLQEVTKDIPNVKVDSFDGLLVDFADKMHADVLVRGLRIVTDFEYELQLAQTNRRLNPGVDTIFLATNVEYSNLSSSMVKEIAMFGGNVDGLVSELVKGRLHKKYGK